MIITLEGIDHAGKSTQAVMLGGWMKSTYNVRMLEFPDYTTPIGRRIARHLRCMDTDYATLHELMAKNRLEKVAYIQQAINDGYTLVIDRYIESNIVYGVANGLDREWLVGLDSDIPKADVIILMDMDVSESFRRGGDRDNFESNETFLTRVVEQYHKECQQDTEGRWYVVNAVGDVEDIHNKVVDCATHAIKMVYEARS